MILNNGFPSELDYQSTLLILVLGIIHTGVAYIFYFNSIDELPVHKVAILGYIEPVLNILIGTLIFNEQMTIIGWIGAVLIIGSAMYSELQ